jgi:excisionase family DNA binding protein
MLYTKKQAAGFLNVCVKTVDRAMNSGRLNYRKIGAAIRFTQSDLDNFIASSSAKPVKEPETRTDRPYMGVAE